MRTCAGLPTCRMSAPPPERLTPREAVVRRRSPRRSCRRRRSRPRRGPGRAPGCRPGGEEAAAGEGDAEPPGRLVEDARVGPAVAIVIAGEGDVDVARVSELAGQHPAAREVHAEEAGGPDVDGRVRPAVAVEVAGDRQRAGRRGTGRRPSCGRRSSRRPCRRREVGHDGEDVVAGVRRPAGSGAAAGQVDAVAVDGPVVDAEVGLIVAVEVAPPRGGLERIADVVDAAVAPWTRTKRLPAASTLRSTGLPGRPGGEGGRTCRGWRRCPGSRGRRRGSSRRRGRRRSTCRRSWRGTATVAGL